ncbi:Myb-like DNA-binding domain-containing protein [Spironucleus salmonicida]|uniref:Myb-like DNA-binding domain-containing protein n=1 Tax=Spironucleus salmonicida TaxID=348837 RepID=V6LHN6_9EUKA|nr:Myb-like DNA-binding domain-containing protein [Spironucleus salmonicida]|eukprot:EST44085.1 Myb-like DNA-binding domain-containing protein [Spironucleus salmonicida]
MSFNFFSFEGSSDHEFDLDGQDTQKINRQEGQKEKEMNLLNFSLTAPSITNSVFGSFAPSVTLNRSGNLNIFSPDFSAPSIGSGTPGLRSNNPSTTSLVEYSRKNQAPKWTQVEDNMLIILVDQHGPKKWKWIAEEISVRTHSQLRQPDAVSQRWSRVVNPGINKDKWSLDEDNALIRAVKASGPRQWKEIAERLPGRTDIQVRYRLIKMRQELLHNSVLGEDYLP